MSQTSKFWGLCTLAAALIAICLILFNVAATKDKIYHLMDPDILAQNAQLKNENQRLTGKISGLKKQNKSLKTIIDAYAHNFIALKDAAGNCDPLPPVFSIDLPAELMTESFDIRHLYRQMLGEKRRWDQYRQQQYKPILERTEEPMLFEIQGLNLADEENIEYFLEMENALKLHKRLIRDVRVFHDEIKFQQRQQLADKPYALYDLKLKLAPFTRESALVDALQQAMSALSAGIYVEEAVEVLDRIGDVFTHPIEQLYQQQQESTGFSLLSQYNYNFYTLFGKKLMDYSDNLAQQSAIPLESSAFGELEFFNQRMFESLYDLYQVGRSQSDNSNSLNMEELERILYPAG